MRGDQPQSWEVTHHEVQAEGRVCNFVKDTLRSPSGDQLERQYITHPGAVAIVAWDEAADAIACVRQYRHPVRQEMLEIPAGLLDIEGEDYPTAAARELAEEAELRAETWHVLVDACSSPGSSAETYRVFLARDLHPTDRPEGFVLEGEEAHMSTEMVPRDELVTAALNGGLQCPSLLTGVLALEAARARGLDTLRPADAPWPIRQ